MKNGKTLIATNKYLRARALRERLLMEHALSSSRIEGVLGGRKGEKRTSKAGSAPRPTKRPTKRS
jgi:hypothetical protein